MVIIYLINIVEINAEIRKIIEDKAMIKRLKYLNELINKKENGLVKVITGIRRCVKSYLLNEIYIIQPIKPSCL